METGCTAGVSDVRSKLYEDSGSSASMFIVLQLIVAILCGCECCRCLKRWDVDVEWSTTEVRPPDGNKR